MMRPLHLFVLIFVWGIFPATATATQVTELISERAEQDLGVEMPDHGHFEIILPTGTPKTGMAIREFWIDHHSGQFIANLVERDGRVTRISGFATLNLPVPVMVRQILPNEIIRREDVKITHIPWQRVHTFAVLELENLIGMQTKRLINQGRPVQRQAVTPPIVVSRGEQVKIELSHGALRLVTTGKAIGDAYVGQEVRVVNLSSNKTITAIARADGVVEATQ